MSRRDVLSVAFPQHTLRARGRRLHAIPVKVGKFKRHDSHPHCDCKPLLALVTSDVRVWIHNE